MHMGRTSVVRAGAFLAIVTASAWFLASPIARLHAQSGATKADSASTVHALGRLEPATGLIVVGSRPGARILEIAVTAGAEVKSGQLLAVLEGRDEAGARLAMAEAKRALVEHQRATSKAKLEIEREQIDAARAGRLATATQLAQLLKRKLDDGTKAFSSLGATLTPRDRIEADSKLLELQVQSQKADLDKSLLEIERNGLTKLRTLEDQQLDASNPEYQIAARAVDLAKAAVAQTEVHAPRDGTVLDVLAHAGEVGSGPLLRMADLSGMIFKAEVYQTDVRRLHVGDSASLNVLGKPFAGKVARISSIVGRNQLMNLDPRSLQDLRVVEVTINLHTMDEWVRLVNLETEVVITPGQGG